MTFRVELLKYQNPREGSGLQTIKEESKGSEYFDPLSHSLIGGIWLTFDRRLSERAEVCGLVVFLSAV